MVSISESIKTIQETLIQHFHISNYITNRATRLIASTSAPITTNRVHTNTIIQLLKPNRPWSKSYKHIIYAVPTFSNPSSKTMSLARREALVRLARQYDALIITDDVYDFLQWENQAPSSSSTSRKLEKAILPRIVDVDRYIDGGAEREGADGFGNAASNGSFSKIFGPGVRTGWCEGAGRLAYGVSQTWVYSRFSLLHFLHSFFVSFSSHHPFPFSFLPSKTPPLHALSLSISISNTTPLPIHPIFPFQMCIPPLCFPPFSTILSPIRTSPLTLPQRLHPLRRRTLPPNRHLRRRSPLNRRPPTLRLQHFTTQLRAALPHHARCNQ